MTDVNDDHSLGFDLLKRVINDALDKNEDKCPNGVSYIIVVGHGNKTGIAWPVEKGTLNDNPKATNVTAKLN